MPNLTQRPESKRANAYAPAEFIVSCNITAFEKQIGATPDPAHRQMLMTLLAEERAKLRPAARTDPDAR